MDKQKLMQEFETSFQKMKRELGFKASFEELEEVFYLKDGILKAGFVSDHLSRQVCSRITELYLSWINHLHSLLIPNGGNMISSSEMKTLNDEDRKKMWSIIVAGMELVDRNALIGLEKNKAEEGKFIDDSLNLWNSSVNKELKTIFKKLQGAWKGS